MDWNAVSRRPGTGDGPVGVTPGTDVTRTNSPLVPVVSTGMQAPAGPAESEGMAHR